jgi:hypothetical protein
MHKYRISWHDDEPGRLPHYLYAERMMVEDGLLKFTIGGELVLVRVTTNCTGERIETDLELAERQREDNAQHFTFVRGERPQPPADPFEWIRGEARTQMLDELTTEDVVEIQTVEEWYEE